MTLVITVSPQLQRLPRQIDDLAKRQLPFATARALTTTAQLAAGNVTRQLPSIFDRPTPFTQRAIGMERATKSSLQARVFVKDIQAGYLRLQQTGGTRKPAKRALVLPVDMKLNSYGNMPKGAFQRLKAKPNTFVGTVKGVGGLWQRPPRGKRRNSFYGGGHGTKGKLRSGEGFRTGLTLLARFEPEASYKPRFGFDAKVERVVRAAIGPAFRAELAQAIATARI